MGTTGSSTVIGARSTLRSKAPVFVVGCPRSGTTLLYHMLLSAGNFVMYRTESQAFNLLEPRFGDLRLARNRRQLLNEWEKSSLFYCTGLDARLVEEDTGGCQNAGDFLRTVMESMGRVQGVERWAECTPDHLLALCRIKETIPDALVIHMIRDGRDVALSLAKQHWIRPFPWDHSKEVECAALYWQWIVNRGRRQAGDLGSHYKEIRYEDLLGSPQATLASVGDFIGQELDYEQILRVGYGSVRRPNSSFGRLGQAGDFRPVARWKKSLSLAQIGIVESLIGETLLDLGYTFDATRNSKRTSVALKRMRRSYPAYFTTKLRLKTRTPLGRLAGGDLSFLGLQAKGPTHAPDALREPARILQIDTSPTPDEQRSKQIEDVAQELRRRGHFCDNLGIGRAVASSDRAATSVGIYLKQIWSYSMRGYAIHLHVDGSSTTSVGAALAAALIGRAFSRPALLSFHGGLGQRFFPRHDGGIAHRALDGLFRVAGEVACDSEPVRCSIESYGICPHKLRTPSSVSEVADWLTGDLVARTSLAARDLAAS
jgi:hypothetical protein